MNRSMALITHSLILMTVVGCSSGNNSSTGSTNASAHGTPGAEEAVGERLFLETRFAQAFKVFLDNGGNINDPKLEILWWIPWRQWERL